MRIIIWHSIRIPRGNFRLGTYLGTNIICIGNVTISKDRNHEAKHMHLGLILSIGRRGDA